MPKQFFPEEKNAGVIVNSNSTVIELMGSYLLCFDLFF